MMQHNVNEMIQHMSHTQTHMARVLDAERQVAVRMAHIIHHLPDLHPEFEGLAGLKEQSGQVTRNLIAYLNSLSALEDAMALQLQFIVREMQSTRDDLG